MYHSDGRGQSGHQDARPRSTRGRHPNWGHPDHDACGTGFIARLGGTPSYDIIQFALTALERLTHRGGVDADGASGDGAGLLTSLRRLSSVPVLEEQGCTLRLRRSARLLFFRGRSERKAQADTRAAGSVNPGWHGPEESLRERSEQTGAVAAGSIRVDSSAVGEAL